MSWKLVGTGGEPLGLDNTTYAAIMGGVVVGFEALYDMGAVVSTVREHNEKVLKTKVNIGPGISSDGKALGLNLVINF